MEAFSRVISVFVAALMFFPLLFMQRFRMDSSVKDESLEKEIKSVCEQLKRKREITSTDLIKLQSLALTYGGGLQICISTSRESLLPDDATIYRYTEKMYLDDIQKIIATEGRLVLLVGDSISVSVSRKQEERTAAIIGRRHNRYQITAGGIV